MSITSPKLTPFLVLVLLITTCRLAIAQTEETIQYKISEPAGADLTLEGTLTLPAKVTKKVPVILLIAGSGPTDRDCNNPSGLTCNSFKMLADSLVGKGIAVARYDKRYSGTNLKKAVGAVPINQHQFDYFVSDAMGFIRLLQADKRFSTVVVAGHSEGSLVGILAAGQTKVNKFISMAGPAQNIADILKDQLRASLPDTLRSIAFTIIDSLKAGYTVKRVNPFLISVFNAGSQPSLISWMKYEPATKFKQFSGSVLIINGGHDLQVPVSEAERLKAARPDARLVIFDEMNHILKNAPADRQENIKTYSNPTLSLTPGLATRMATFAKE